MRAVVTGGGGFIGHHLVGALASHGHEVVVLDDFSTGSPRRIPRAASVRVVEGDVRDERCLDDALAGCDVVFHHAARVAVAGSVLDPVGTDSVNVGGTIRLMLGAARAGVRRVILASSSAAYGAHPELPSRETHRPDPRSPYAASKLAAEYYLHTLGDASGIETVALRYFNVFGPGQDPLSEYAAVIPRFITAGLAGQPPVVYGDGKQSRDFTFVTDVVAANLLAAVAPDASRLTVNVGSGERRTLLQLLDAVAAAVGHTLSPVFEAERAGDVRDSQADISWATERLGYAPGTTFEQGIARTVASMRGDVTDGQGA